MNYWKDNGIYEFLNTIDIFVLPSRFEGFGISLIEAMGMGIPCIASNIAGPAEVINLEGIGSLFENENVINNYETVKSQAIDKAENIKNKYDISSMCKMLIEIYKEK